jgi:hypothetical protein
LVAIRLAGDDVLTRREEKEWPALLFSFATQQNTTHIPMLLSWQAIMVLLLVALLLPMTHALQQ